MTVYIFWFKKSKFQLVPRAIEGLEEDDVARSLLGVAVTPPRRRAGDEDWRRKVVCKDKMLKLKT